MNLDKTIIGITHGDFNGIGYEVLLKTLADNRIYEDFVPVIYGSSKIIAYYKKGIEMTGFNMNMITGAENAVPKRVNVINCWEEETKVEPGISTETAGRAALVALERATEDLKNGKIHALVTAPINKDNIQSEKFRFPGHTEYLEQKFKTDTSVLMLLINDMMRVAVATGHIPLKNVAEKLSLNLVLEKIKVLNNALRQDFRIAKPRIAVLGLNPHAGDNGVLGAEEQEIILPAIKAATEQGILCFGAFSADGFFGSGAFKRYDAVLAMYHDQGLIPFKTLAMEAGVNYTAGLPIIRTSPDHGTAYDIAGKNLASENSFRQALFLAIDIVNNRLWHNEISKNPLKSEAKVERSGRIE